MNISKIKLGWKYLTGGMGGVTDYLLEVLNNALASVDDTSKAKMQATLNVALKVLATLVALKWLCPVKWQTAYGVTVSAVQTVAIALEDLTLTNDEFERVRCGFSQAVLSWKGPDDATCIDATALEIQD